MASPSLLRTILNERLPDLSDRMANWRQTGRSWRWCAAEVEQLAGVKISWQTLRNWYPELNKPVHELVSSTQG